MNQAGPIPSRASFERDGYAIARDLASPSDLARLGELASDLVAPAHQLRKQNLELSWASGLDVASRSRHVLASWWPHQNWTLTYAQIYLKPAHSPATSLPWHQDRYFWPDERSVTVPVWTALDEMVARNGCLQVVPGSHRTQSLRNHPRPSGSAIPTCSLMPDEQATPLLMPRGSSILYHERLLHQSLGNETDRDRRAFVLGWSEA